jgi:hypothetical protein
MNLTPDHFPATTQHLSWMGNPDIFSASLRKLRNERVEKKAVRQFARQPLVLLKFAPFIPLDFQGYLAF